MKKKILTVMFMVIGGVFSLTACGSDEEQTTADNSSVSEADENTEEDTETSNEETVDSGYVFVVNDVELAPDMDMDSVTTSLGEAKSVYEAESCAGEGTAYIYNYGSYEVETYPADGQNLIGFITLKDDTVATAEGIDLSSSREDIINAYGDDYEESDNSITYSDDNMKLTFIFEGDDITSIEYISSVVG